jgi:hypothetical protein
MVTHNLSHVDAKCILQTKIRFALFKARWNWHWEPNGVYSARSAYIIICKQDVNKLKQASCSFCPKSKTWKVLWKTFVPLKVRIFWWKVLHNAIASKENLCARIKKGSPMCDCCRAEVESIEHVLFNCSAAQRVWNHFPTAHQHISAKLDATLKWFDHWASTTNFNQQTLNIILFVCWEIWKARNRRLFDKAEVSAQVTVNAIHHHISKLVICSPLHDVSPPDPIDTLPSLRTLSTLWRSTIII